MKVIIDGNAYKPIADFDAALVTKALLRAVVSGYYHSLTCHVDGEACGAKCRDPDGECGACELQRKIINFLGQAPKCHKEPLYDEL